MSTYRRGIDLKEKQDSCEVLPRENPAELGGRNMLDLART
jgi:hypothetical protein